MKNLTIPQDNIFLPAILEINCQEGCRQAVIIGNYIFAHLLSAKKMQIAGDRSIKGKQYLHHMKCFSFIFVCASFITANGQRLTDSILIEQHYRSFSYYRPASVISGGSLLFVMHGSGGRGEDMIMRTTQLEAIAGKEKLLVVYPEGYQHYWNECRKYATSEANKEDINENAFFSGMISYFQKRYGISKGKVYAAGFSGGGHMAYKLGLTMTDQVKAIAAVVANMPDSVSCDCVLSGKALPVLIINGTDDGVNPYKGGEMFVNNASYGVVRSTESTFNYWASLAGYAGLPKKETLPDRDTSDHKIIESFAYRAQGKPPVTLLKVIGGKHDYPGDIDVFLYAWHFFKSLQQQPGK